MYLQIGCKYHFIWLHTLQDQADVKCRRSETEFIFPIFDISHQRDFSSKFWKNKPTLNFAPPFPWL